MKASHFFILIANIYAAGLCVRDNIGGITLMVIINMLLAIVFSCFAEERK